MRISPGVSVACVALVLTLVGCVDTSPLAPAVSESQRAARVVAAPASARLAVDSGVTLHAVVENARGEPISSPVLWSSSDTLVAVVSPDGHVTALREGSATIYASTDVVSPEVAADDPAFEAEYAGKSGNVKRGKVKVTVVPTDPPPSSPSTVGPSTALNPTSGVMVRPGESIQAAVDANPAGTTFWLRAGVYRRQTVTPKEGMTFVGEAGAILDGEYAVSQAFFSKADNVTIRNLVVEHYNSPLQNGAIRGDWNESTGWVIEYNEVRENHAAGVYVSDKSTIRNNYIHHNGQIGILGRGTGAVVVGNEISYNNTDGNDPNWEAGGVKFVYSTGLRFADNYVHDNMGPGIWFDTNNLDCIIEGNRAENNTHAGIFYEVSYGAVIRNNTVKANGGTGSIARSGILISASPDVEVYGNTLSGNSNGIVGLQANRSEVPASYGAHVVSNMWVHDNNVSQSRGYTGLVDQMGDGGIFNRNNRFDRNNYYVSSLSRPFYGKAGPMSITEWKAAGFDVNGVFK